ncbi:hypothetical protein L211DRAFT_786333 [Terfezia boudieri ATCC MYA-4762]|uniref:Adenylyltransferase and sulfurtransferase uba4 n=1 Tax=Terfezia boudieri ATCC MYA-4762 TaxID=1051890 RepID=A0A3N4M0F1_9PEZI|nr:hypothetical protein L211DRAFT_786333 [Terfezia boudieri ATCC MYA-4762]
MPPPPTLSKDEYKRYGRQMIVPSIGLPGQLQLKDAAVLIVGAGGLGCPAAAYLAGTGVGILGICDGDVVETSNLHRQIAHTTSRVGQSKTQSMTEYLTDINPHITYRSHTYHLTPGTAASTLGHYNLVLDCTDHPAVRYLISDTCVLLGKPLISASALRTEGQLLVLNNPPGKGACYRCIWPKPPPPESVLSCGEGGILGPVVGVMGVLMATEAIKLLTAQAKDNKLSGEVVEEENKRPIRTNMLLYSAYLNPSFRDLKLRGQKKGCIACDLEKREISLDKLSDGRLDYAAFCGTRKEDRVGEDERIEVGRYAEVRNQEHLLIDVRPEVEWGICNLAGAINIPIGQFMQSLPLPTPTEPLIGAVSLPSPPPPSWLPENHKTPIYIVCKRGNDSQVAVRHLKTYLASRQNGDGKVGGGIWDIKGGLVKWAWDVDASFPEY